MTNKTIRPFMAPDFNERWNKHGGAPCVLCGREVNQSEKTKYVAVVEGGATFALASIPDPEDGAYMGVWPIGPECYRKNSTEFAPFMEG